MAAAINNQPYAADAARILIVDDEPDIATTLSHILMSGGFVADAFCGPEMALSNFKPGYYHLALLDIRMPQMNGFQLYRKLKEKDPRLPVCFMTAFEVYPDEYEKILPQQDVRAFIKKPVGMTTLVKIIRDVLKIDDIGKDRGSQ